MIGFQPGGPVASSQKPKPQNPVPQSVPTRQVWPTAHAGHGPPQSTSTSFACFTLSVHDATTSDPITTDVVPPSPATMSALAVAARRRPR